MSYQDLIRELLSDPDKLRQKRPFTRGSVREQTRKRQPVQIGQTVMADLPNYRNREVFQETYLRELDPNCHDVLFDENIPSICVKIDDNEYRDVKYTRMAVPLQLVIKNKQVMHLASNPMQFTLMNTTPSKKNRNDFITIKQYWNLRNQDGMKYKMVDAQKSYGDAGVLYYFDYKGRIKSQLLSFADGYVLCPHNDQNGDRILESVYYKKDDVEYIDSYDDTYLYRYTKEINAEGDAGWTLHKPEKHGFKEIPIVTKRGQVAWDSVQPIIECYEELYNVFNAIQKRFGWGILYVKGRFKDDKRKIAGSVILNDASMDGSGDAKFLSPPTPQGTIDTLALMLESIQLGSSTTFILPKDIKMSGDVSGVAVQITQSMDLELANREAVEWQNVADKMMRLFKYGLAKELVNYGINETAITDFEELNINAKFKVWQPRNDYEYNQMLAMLKNAGILSIESGVELNTESKPDEKERIRREQEASVATQNPNVKTKNTEEE